MENDNKIDNQGESADKFLELVETYIYQRSKFDSLSEIISEHLKIFLTLPHAFASSLFLLDDETFEFINSATHPREQHNDTNILFEHLVNSGVIGATLESLHISIHTSKTIEGDRNVMVVPLASSRGIVGLLLIMLSKSPEHMSRNILRSISLFASMFAGTLDNKIMSQELDKAKSLYEQKIAARTVHINQSKREIENILNTIHTGIMVVDPEDDSIISANFVASKMISSDQQNIIGDKASTFFEKMNGQANHRDEKEILSASFESMLIDSFGAKIPVLMSEKDIILNGKSHIIRSFLDISERIKAESALKKANELLEQKVQDRTEDLQILVHKLKIEVEERKKAEREIRKMLEKEKELNDLKSRFVSMVSHEFRTPLTIISSAAQILDRYRDKLTEADTNQYFARILKTVDIMSDLLENVIFMGKSDIRKLEETPKVISLPNFFKGIVQDIELSFNHTRTIDFINMCKTEYVNLDENLLQHILINLLSNATKYSPVEKAIELKLYSDDEMVCFSVKDQGIGIPKDEQKKIFDQFFRGRNVGTISGTGLGMSVISRSLEILGGTIDVQSEVNNGTLFNVSIPINNDQN